jgi:microcystin-dependent protein
MSQPFVGQVIAVGFNFTPEGWLACDGSIVPISNFNVLFQLIGTTYGGDGVSTFGLPDLRGRTPVGVGQGPGLSSYVLGQRAGTESVTLLANQVGSHNHPLMASSKPATASIPANTLAIGQVPSATAVKVFGPAPGTTTLSGNTIGLAGGNAPHDNQQPFLAINYIISPFGIFPSQS